MSKVDKKILCFSGGIDSLIAFHYLNAPETIYVKYNHKYQNKEIDCIEKLKKIVPGLRTAFYDGPSLGMFEEGPKAYISKRNFHIALCASHFANHIYICGNKEDIFDDNNRTAYDIMSFAMNQTQSLKEPKITIESPFWDWSKTNIIKWFMEEYKLDYVEKVLKTSISCYDIKPGSCGNCVSCYRKWKAMEQAGLKNTHKWFKKDIRKFKI